MAEVNEKFSLKRNITQGLRWFFQKEAPGFSEKTTINWHRIGFVVVFFTILFLLSYLVISTGPEKISDFISKKQELPLNGGNPNHVGENVPPRQSSPVSETLTTNHRPSNKNSQMVLSRPGNTSNQLPPGTKFQAEFIEAAVVTSGSQPVIASVKNDVATDKGVAIEGGAKIFGTASFDRDSERVNIQWRSIMLPNGASKPISAMALGADNQPGVSGDVHTDSIKNTAGSFLTRFIGGVADGAVSRNYSGQSSGGLENGILTGVADTARERADSYAEDLKKQRSWVEIKKNTPVQVILIDGFTFRDPGGL